MGYDLRIELLRATPGRDVEAALSAVPDARVRDARRLAFTVDAPRAARGERARFTLEARDRTWLGRVRAVVASLPFGGSRDEVALFARTVSDVARRLHGTVIDPQLGHALPPDAEVEWIIDGWGEANLRALESYERGWIVRPDAVPVEGDAPLPVEAVRSDATPDGPLSVARAYLRAGDAARARAALERVTGDDERTRAVEREVERLEALGGDRAAVDGALRRVSAADAPALVEALRDDDTRARAVSALARLGAAAVAPLLDALADEDLRDGATEALAAVGPTAARAFTDCLQHGPRVQAEGALAALDDLFLAWGPDLAALDMAIARLLDEPGLEAPGLAGALERAGALGAPAVRSILGLLAGAPRHVGPAAEALGALRALPAVEPLLSRLLGPPHPDLDDDAVARALAQLDPAAAGARLSTALDAERDPEQRSRWLHALAEVDAARAVPRLVDAVRRAAEAHVACEDDADFVLATWVHDPAALPAVLAALDDPLAPAMVRRALVGALASIGTAEALAALARLADDPDATVRAEARRAHEQRAS
jgi:HEAT repeat protein